jgi:hypothetical protein
LPVPDQVDGIAEFTVALGRFSIAAFMAHGPSNI